MPRKKVVAPKKASPSTKVRKEKPPAAAGDKTTLGGEEMAPRKPMKKLARKGKRPGAKRG